MQKQREGLKRRLINEKVFLVILFNTQASLDEKQSKI